MPDSPKCLKCLKAGKVGQTYRLSGKQNYRCSDCKVIYDKSEFDPIEFTWKDDFDSYKTWLKSKGVEIKDRFMGNKLNVGN